MSTIISVTNYDSFSSQRQNNLPASKIRELNCLSKESFVGGKKFFSEKQDEGLIFIDEICKL